MGIAVSIIGYSGAGKSTSFRTLLNDKLQFDNDTILIRVLKKPLPFKNRLRAWSKDKKEGDYIYLEDGSMVAQAIQAFNALGKKRIIVDDSTFIMTKYFMDTISEMGYQKFSNLAKNYYDMLKEAENTSDDTRIYIVNHLEEGQYGKLKFKTIGKLIDEKVDIGAMLTVVLQAEKDDEGYWFITNKRSEMDVAKSPMGMFDSIKVPNDLALVDKAICEYYGIGR